MKTFHASPERSSSEIVNEQFKNLLADSYITELVNALPYVVTILNSNRQIVFSNQVLVQSLKVADLRELLGKRPGEALNCIHSRTIENGCGTYENCKVCGAVNTITASMKENRKVVNEARIISDKDGTEEYHDFEVSATPFKWQEERFTIFTLTDISVVKRKLMLERIFFHDIMNTAGNLKGLSELILKIDDLEKKNELISLLFKVSNELVEEIQEQRQLTAAENGELQLNPLLHNTREILESAVEQFRNNAKVSVHFVFSEDSENISILTDRSILQRIIKNMLKNAVEASSDEDTITIKSHQNGSLIRFTVRNQHVIPRHIQMQIFNRNFSTKSADRGLGTYSMKLLGERYLKGKVTFISNEESGTEFYFDLPFK